MKEIDDKTACDVMACILGTPMLAMSGAHIALGTAPLTGAIFIAVIIAAHLVCRNLRD